MSPRCQGQQAAGHWTGFQCVLDTGHKGHCVPYRAPTVDEWRATVSTNARLQAEADALRAIIESGENR